MKAQKRTIKDVMGFEKTALHRAFEMPESTKTPRAEL